MSEISNSQNAPSSAISEHNHLFNFTSDFFNNLNDSLGVPPFLCRETVSTIPEMISDPS